jgi:hypothetical protein
MVAVVKKYICSSRLENHSASIDHKAIDSFCQARFPPVAGEQPTGVECPVWPFLVSLPA